MASRCRNALCAESEAEISADFAPDRNVPLIDIELLGTQAGNRHGRIRADDLVRGRVFRPQFELALLFLRGSRQAIDSQAQIRQYLIVDDVVEEYGIRVEGVLRQDNAIIK